MGWEQWSSASSWSCSASESSSGIREVPLHHMLSWSCFLCFSLCCKPPSTQPPGSRGRSAVHRLSSSSDSSPPHVGQLLLSEGSPGQPGVMALTQPTNPTHSLSACHLHSIPAHLKDGNILLGPFLKCKYGHEHLTLQ